MFVTHTSAQYTDVMMIKTHVEDARSIIGQDETRGGGGAKREEEKKL